MGQQMQSGRRGGFEGGASWLNCKQRNGAARRLVFTN
jgi:hypothetical protein